ncbi:DNA alkylation repair protein [Clostridium sp. Marseille-P299]|uniref:DNA alkylation repair protein n=1 Tax=Clostridium sp. Marseille-P299 TaxID=1805477 RepID=UPI00083364C0|nr:DNA alkylation repair protein [Clostridium sp. Marseille-P299]
MVQSIKQDLLELAEPKYQEFTSKLLPGIDNILGVRLPALRKLAKDILKDNPMEYLENATEDSFEEIMLQGMVIGGLKDIDLVFHYIEEFLPKINNWSVCDSFCAGLKISKKYPKEMWQFIQPYLKDDREYFIRFAVVMLLNYYVDEEHIAEALQALDQIKHDAYYVKMAVAWAISIYYIKLPERTLEYLKYNSLDDFTYNKALQKITESLRVDKETKQMIRNMKR